MTPRAAGIEVVPLGDRGLLLRWPQRIDAAINADVHAVAARIRAHSLPWIADLVPAYASLLVVVDASRFDDAPLQQAQAALQRIIDAPDATSPVSAPSRLHRIAVRYGGDAGPDLAAVASALGLSADDVVARHCAPQYQVAMIGFAPGFPYLLGLDPALTLPRRPTPRTRVAAGSVAIAAGQTGIYPQAGPGGWHLLGRTDAVLFDPCRDPPSLLQPGDRVRFEAMR